ncbi:MAG: taurine dioxygenase [Porticoccaceae bacterium]|nr:MAG: taurine dioxygenase [Porticoccaceae bacterium]
MEEAVAINPLGAALGAVVEGVDLARPLGARLASALRAALWEWGVLFFPGQSLEEAALEAFLAHFAPPAPEPFAYAASRDRPAAVTADMGPTRCATAVWHIDTTFVAAPPRYTALHAVEVPPFGGDTCFVSLTAAYDALSTPLRRLAESLWADHSAAATLDRLGLAPRQAPPRATHPLVRRHPETGRRALWFSEAGIVAFGALSPLESEHLIGLLREHLKSPDLQVRWRWRAGDVALWDNAAVAHYAVPDYPGRRIIRRVVSAGEAPLSPAEGGS